MAEVLREALDDHRTRLGTTGQGAGFNIEFFAHANWQTLASAIVALQPVLLVVLAYLLLVLPCLFLMPKASARHRSHARFERHAAPAFKRHFGPEHGVELPTGARYGYRPLHFEEGREA